MALGAGSLTAAEIADRVRALPGFRQGVVVVLSGCGLAALAGPVRDLLRTPLVATAADVFHTSADELAAGGYGFTPGGAPMLTLDRAHWLYFAATPGHPAQPLGHTLTESMGRLGYQEVAPDRAGLEPLSGPHRWMLPSPPQALREFLTAQFLAAPATVGGPGQARTDMVSRRAAAGARTLPAGSLPAYLGLQPNPGQDPVQAVDLPAGSHRPSPTPMLTPLDRYVARYPELTAAAPDIALSAATLRRLGAGLSELAGDGYLIEHLPEVLGNPQTADLLALVQPGLSRVPAAARSAVVSLVNDLLVAASLVPAREAPVRRAGALSLVSHHDLRTIVPVAAGPLQVTLHRIAAALGRGKNPLDEAPLAGIGYHPQQPLAQRLARLALLNLSQGARDQLAADPLFTALLASPLLAEALFAASGAEQQFFLNTCAAAAINQEVLERVPTIAGLLSVGRRVVELIEAEHARGGPALALPDRGDLGRLRRGRTIGQTLRSRIDRATTEFNAITAHAHALLAQPTPDPAAARQRLQQLTLRWSKAMQKLSGVVSPGQTDAGLSDVPVLTRMLIPGAWTASTWLAAPLGLDRFRRRHAGIPADDYREAIGAQLASPPLLPTVELAASLTDDRRRAQFWRNVLRAGGILAAAPGHLLRLRAVRRDSRRVFALGDPLHANYEYIPLPAITAWARSRRAQVAGLYLPRDAVVRRPTRAQPPVAVLPTETPPPTDAGTAPEHGESGPTPLTLAELDAHAEVLTDRAGGLHVWLPGSTVVAAAERAALAGLADWAPAGQVAVHLQGDGQGTAVVTDPDRGARPVAAAVLHELLVRRGLSGRPIYLVMCEGLAYATALAVLTRQPVRSSPAPMLVSASSGIVFSGGVRYDAHGNPWPTPAEAVPQVTVHPDGSHTNHPGSHPDTAPDALEADPGRPDGPSSPRVRRSAPSAATRRWPGPFPRSHRAGGSCPGRSPQSPNWAAAGTCRTTARRCCDPGRSGPRWPASTSGSQDWAALPDGGCRPRSTTCSPRRPACRCGSGRCPTPPSAASRSTPGRRSNR